MDAKRYRVNDDAFEYRRQLSDCNGTWTHNHLILNKHSTT